MARMSGVPFLGIADNGAMSSKDIVCIHTIVGYQSGGNAAHFTTGASGKIVQARDTNYRSAANLHGNHRVIAIENEDHGPAYQWVGGAPPPFTPAQCEAIAKILVWCHKTHNIPLTLIPDSKPGRRGIGYHRQGIDGNFTGPYKGRVVGGELWSSAFGKVCPGDKRIAQLINQIIPRARALAGGAQENDMEPTDLTKDPGPGKWGWEWLNTKQNAEAIRNHVERSVLPTLNDVKGQLADLADKVANLAVGGGTVDYAALAAALADEQDRRARDGNPNTGPAS